MSWVSSWSRSRASVWSVGVVDAEVAFPLALGGVEGDIGLAEQVLGALCAGAGDGDADAGPDEDLLTGDRERGPERRQEAFGGRGGEHGGVGRGDRIEQDGELVAAEAGRKLPGAGLRGDAFRNCDQKAVACRMAEAVVDIFEVVQVQEEDRDRFSSGLGPKPCPIEGFKKPGSIGQAGKGVVLGLEANASFGFLEVADVEEQSLPDEGLTVVVRDEHGLVADPDVVSIFVATAILDAIGVAGGVGAQYLFDHPLAVVGVEQFAMWPRRADLGHEGGPGSDPRPAHRVVTNCESTVLRGRGGVRACWDNLDHPLEGVREAALLRVADEAEEDIVARLQVNRDVLRRLRR